MVPTFDISPSILHHYRVIFVYPLPLTQVLEVLTVIVSFSVHFSLSLICPWFQVILLHERHETNLAA
jgi:hypothetical protein